MGKRLLRVIASAILVFTFANLAPAPVGVQRAEAHGNQACYDGSKQSFHSGNYFNPSGKSVDGVFANLYAHLDNCGDDDSMSAVWIGLVPNGTFTQIVQVGIIQCRNGPTLRQGVDPCYSYPDQMRYFFAFGGCTTTNGPYARDAGPATTLLGGAFKVVRHATGFDMWFPNGQGYYVNKDDISVSCFYNAELNAQYVFEKWDRGDSTGGSTTASVIDNAQARYLGDPTWYSHNWGASSNPCNLTMSTSPHTSYCSDQLDNIIAWD